MLMKMLLCAKVKLIHCIFIFFKQKNTIFQYFCDKNPLILFYFLSCILHLMFIYDCSRISMGTRNCQWFHQCKPRYSKTRSECLFGVPCLWNVCIFWYIKKYVHGNKIMPKKTPSKYSKYLNLSLAYDTKKII